MYFFGARCITNDHTVFFLKHNTIGLNPTCKYMIWKHGRKYKWKIPKGHCPTSIYPASHNTISIPDYRPLVDLHGSPSTIGHLVDYITFFLDPCQSGISRYIKLLAGLHKVVWFPKIKLFRHIFLGWPLPSTPGIVLLEVLITWALSFYNFRFLHGVGCVAKIWKSCPICWILPTDGTWKFSCIQY